MEKNSFFLRLSAYWAALYQPTIKGSLFSPRFSLLAAIRAPKIDAVKAQEKWGGRAVQGASAP